MSSPDYHKRGTINPQVTCLGVNLASLRMGLGVDACSEGGGI